MLAVLFVVIGGPILLVVAAVGSAPLSTSSGRGLDGMIEESVIVKGSRKKIARIDLEGVITGSGSGPFSPVDAFAAQVQRAVRDDNVAALVIRIKSPGGEVTASDLLHKTLQEADAVKPVVAYLDTIAASGGYYAACGARRIMAHETTLTGSIGVIIQSPNYKELFEKVGLRMDVYKSGKMKDILSGAREPTDEERATIQNLVRQTYERFLAVVSASRGKSVDDLRDSPLADGRIYSGKDAHQTGMVDDIGFLEDAYAIAMHEAGVEGATVVRYRVRGTLLDALALFGEAAAENAPQRVEIGLGGHPLPELQPGLPYFLYLPAP